MANIFDPLVGSKISSVEMVHDYLQLYFENGEILNIYNKYTLSNCDELKLLMLVGCKISNIVVNDIEVTISFTTGELINVSLLDADYSGPEAMQYIDMNKNHFILS